MKLNKMAIVGSGPTAIYLLQHLNESVRYLRNPIEHITIFERSGHMGMGMPYSPETTDIYNLSNISSEEIPQLPETFADWLRKMDRGLLVALNVTEFPISDSEVYGRLALGSYLHDQYIKLLQELRRQGIDIQEVQGVHVTDIQFDASKKKSTIITDRGDYTDFSKVVIATGHAWDDEDRPRDGFYSSPWPIKKILPTGEGVHNFTIGTLGASLSAFDVATSLAHRHGKFIKNGKGLSYRLKEGAESFKLVMHSAEGWLPHLQYQQTEPIREIYRHTEKKSVLSLINDNGFLPIEVFFDKVCRPALIMALRRDGMDMKATKLNDQNLNFKDFIKMMVEDHEYTDSFQGMKKEMIGATDSVNNDRPIHWMETLDDLMYCLNFHGELLSAEDHLFFKKEVSPFLMNVVAALPLSSAKILLALYEAGCIELMTGKVEVLEPNEPTGKTTIAVEGSDGEKSILEYGLFINCAGQKGMELDDFPFPSLIASGHLRKAHAKIGEPANLKRFFDQHGDENIFEFDGQHYMYTGGIDIDAAYRIIGADGVPNGNIMDISSTHTPGIRPYSYGLQACSATSKILVESWKSEDCKEIFQADIENMASLYEKNEL